MLVFVRGIGDNGVAVIGIVVVAGVAVRVHLEEIVVVVRVGRTLPPIVVVSTKRSGTGNGVTTVWIWPILFNYISGLRLRIHYSVRFRLDVFRFLQLVTLILDGSGEHAHSLVEGSRIVHEFLLLDDGIVSGVSLRIFPVGFQVFFPWRKLPPIVHETGE